MTPILSTLDAAYNRLVHPVIRRDCALSSPIDANGSNLIRSKHRGVFINASIRSTFGNHIRHVVVMRSKPEMLGVYARPTITNMHDLHTVWYSPVRQHPRNAVPVSIGTVHTSSGVPCWRKPEKPQPAIVGAKRYIASPKAVANFFDITDIYGVHRPLLMAGATGRDRVLATLSRLHTLLQNGTLPQAA